MKKLASVFFTVLSLSMFSQNVEDKKPTTEAKKIDSVRVVQQPKIVDMRLKNNQPEKTSAPNLKLKSQKEKKVSFKMSVENQSIQPNQYGAKTHSSQDVIKVGKEK